MKDPYTMNIAEFFEFLSKNTTVELVLENAGRIYDFLTELFGTDCTDSVLREWAFHWFADKTHTASFTYDDAYDHIHEKWLDTEK